MVDTPVARLMNKIEHKNLKKDEFSHWVTCDQLCLAWLIDDLKRIKNSSKDS